MKKREEIEKMTIDYDSEEEKTVNTYTMNNSELELIIDIVRKNTIMTINEVKHTI